MRLAFQAPGWLSELVVSRFCPCLRSQASCRMDPVQDPGLLARAHFADSARPERCFLIRQGAGTGPCWPWLHTSRVWSCRTICPDWSSSQCRSRCIRIAQTRRCVAPAERATVFLHRTAHMAGRLDESPMPDRAHIWRFGWVSLREVALGSQRSESSAVSAVFPVIFLWW